MLAINHAHQNYFTAIAWNHLFSPMDHKKIKWLFCCVVEQQFVQWSSEPSLGIAEIQWVTQMPFLYSSEITISFLKIAFFILSERHPRKFREVKQTKTLNRAWLQGKTETAKPAEIYKKMKRYWLFSSLKTFRAILFHYRLTEIHWKT